MSSTTNALGLTKEEALKLKCYELLLSYSKDINGVRRQVEDLITWLKQKRESKKCLLEN
jgi:hypothetical protein